MEFSSYRLGDFSIKCISRWHIFENKVTTTIIAANLAREGFNCWNSVINFTAQLPDLNMRLSIISKEYLLPLLSIFVIRQGNLTETV